MSTFNSLSQTDRLEAKTNQLEIKLTAQIADLMARMDANIDNCIAKSSDLYVDVVVLKRSHKFVLWILGLYANAPNVLWCNHIHQVKQNDQCVVELA